MRKGMAVIVVCLGVLFLSSCSSKNREAERTQASDIINAPTSSEEEPTVSKMPVATDAQTISAKMTKEEEVELFNQIIASTPLKAKVPITYHFTDVSVHDPSIVEVDGTYYIFGSHLAVAKTMDLMNWTWVDSGVKKSNKVIPDAMSEMSEAFTWAQTNTFWAPDVIQLEDGRFYYYYCNCEGSKPLAALGVAVSDNIEGPYEDRGVILKSGQNPDTPDENGDVYDATTEPNVVDPCVFYDNDGKLWMIYGSYSGGIYILELNKKAGIPLEKGYGKKLLGENHLRIEGSYVQYSKETDYYYMFLSFGGLTANGAYNIRIARSKNPDGPYYDAQGNDMIHCKGPAGSFFDDNAADDFGTKIMGNYHWNTIDGEENRHGNAPGYISPGHNSTLYDEKNGKYYMVFHTRFEENGEHYEVRVHQMFLNENGWFVVAPYRYVGETIGDYSEAEILGAYKVINHQLDITAQVKESVNVVLREDYSVIGDWHGTWELRGDNTCILTIDDVEYKGVFLKQWDEVNLKNVMTFSVQSLEGKSIWGSGYKALDE